MSAIDTIDLTETVTIDLTLDDDTPGTLKRSNAHVEGQVDIELEHPSPKAPRVEDHRATIRLFKDVIDHYITEIHHHLGKEPEDAAAEPEDAAAEPEDAAAEPNNEDEYFDDECCICLTKCNEMSSWKCDICEKCFCDIHNTEEFVCDC